MTRQGGGWTSMEKRDRYNIEWNIKELTDKTRHLDQLMDYLFAEGVLNEYMVDHLKIVSTIKISIAYTRIFENVVQKAR